MSIKARVGRTKSLNALINKDTSVLRHIFDQAAKLKQIETLVLQKLPEASRTDYRVGNYSHGRLVLLTSSAVNLTKFRYLKPQLFTDLKAVLPDLQQLDLKIRPETPVKEPQKKGKPISNKARKQLSDLADEIDNPRLKESLQRLGRQQATKNQP
ncbi:hypothetical protein SAMN05660443_1307 [Marinospirillum celere]|uniref:DUF721 domain-containing protein n=1 Tax=Marinospirillum celere TaxID=1122252 RepID=A0A1I1G5Z1_9GAMM|nr:hypothetical protein [Marinospirillum celere]SFC04713.1 hypothetical protein SAMN05660443_1307 [Marinospirillum celere]